MGSKHNHRNNSLSLQKKEKEGSQKVILYFVGNVKIQGGGGTRFMGT